MKNKLKTTIGVAALLLATVNLNAGLWSDLGNAAAQFVANNPTNAWDVTGYGLYNTTGTQPDLKHSFGGGARIGYWIDKSVGAALDVSYCDSSWTFMSLGLAGRGTVNLGSVGSVTLHAGGGPGWNVSGADNGAVQSVVAVIGGGGTLHINKLKWFDLFGEYQHVTTTENQDRILFGITKRF